ncbi:MAG: PilZ domain-containing protein [Candidatus Acidiferrales bacterium]
MGRRSEQRIALRVPILVHGKDSRGSPFTITAQTHDITATGASLNGLKGITDVGSKIEIEYQGRKAMYRVQWIGQIGTPRSGHVGVKCLETGNYIWGVPLAEWMPDTYDPDNAEPQKQAVVPTIESLIAPPPNIERRRFPRVACRIEATVLDELSAMNLRVKVTDISFGGCYAEMLAPLPVKSSVELTLDTSQGAIRARGTVVAAQSGMGMGIAFTAISPEDFEKLREIAPMAGHHREPEHSNPRLAAAVATLPSNGTRASKRSSQVAPSTQEVLESILRILLRKGIVSEDEMAEELEKLITAKT